MAEPTKPVIPFSEAVRVELLDSHTYSANLSADFLVAAVPNGGYAATILLEAARTHLMSRNQPDSITSHFEFLNRTEVGPAILTVEEVKPGRQLSTVHITLYQGALLPRAPWITAGASRKEIVAYVVNANLSIEKGMTLQTAFTLPTPPPQANLAALAMYGRDDHWERCMPTYAGLHLRFTDNTLIYIPRRGHLDKSVHDYWLRLSCGERFTNSSLAFVTDSPITLGEAFRGKPGQKADARTFDHRRRDWCPTVVMNLEIKRGVPDGGAEWLYLRATSKEIRNGRLDLDFIIMNEAGELVALSQHVNLIVEGTRNTQERKLKSAI